MFLKAWQKSRVPVFLQSEEAECGSVCLAMISAHYGGAATPLEIRQLADITLRGVTLDRLVAISQEIGLVPRAVKLQLEELPQLKLPAILHWEMSHFVVLTEVTVEGELIVNDPRVGRRRISAKDSGRAFTGIAMELAPSREFRRGKKEAQFKWSSIFRNVHSIKTNVISLLAFALLLEMFVLFGPLLIRLCVDFGVRTGNSVALIYIAIGFGLLVAVQTVVGFGRAFLVLRLSADLGLHLGSELMAHIFSLPMYWFERRSLADVTSRFGSVRRIQSMVSTAFIETVIDSALLVTSLAVMLLYAPLIALCPLIATAAYTGLRLVTLSATRAALNEQLMHDSLQNGQVIESIRGMQTIKANFMEPMRLMSWSGCYSSHINSLTRTQAQSVGIGLAGRSIFAFERVITVSLAAAAVISSDLTLGTALAVIAYRELFAQRASSIVDNVSLFANIKVEADRVAEVFMQESHKRADLPFVHESRQLQPDILVSGLSVRYSKNDRWVLDDCTFSIAHGERVAITGASGSGKSTLIKTILGLVAPDRGTVEIAGVNVNSRQYAAARPVVACVLQDDHLFSGTLADNISLFDPNATEEDIRSACEQAAISLDIERMPMRYRTLVGDMGTTLSGGQRQRVLLARAFYKKPKILILDEATSNLDVGIESIIAEAMKAHFGTTILVAHRPETINLADRVLRLRQGKILSSNQITAS